jgi:hypothetical protein
LSWFSQAFKVIAIKSLLSWFILRVEALYALKARVARKGACLTAAL